MAGENEEPIIEGGEGGAAVDNVMEEDEQQELEPTVEKHQRGQEEMMMDDGGGEEDQEGGVKQQQPPIDVEPKEGLTFQVLYGAKEDEPMCYFLKVGQAKILLDCGWDVNLNEDLLRPLVPVLATVQLVLISFPDLAHMGALPWIAKHLRPGVPIYSTQPVFKMGQMILYDLYLSKCMETGACPAFSLDDVDAAISRFQLLKFSQPLEVRQQGRFYLSVTPYPAGRIIGGAFWRINYKRIEEVLYAVDFNLKSERHISGAIDALNAISVDKEQRPSLTIVDSRSALSVPTDERRVEADFLDSVTSTLRRGGNVLIPIEASGRVQELLLTLNGHWRSDRLLWGYKIVLLHHMARNVIHFTRSMVEWMHPEIIRDFDRSLRNPFTLKHVLPAQSMVELEAAAGEYRNPCVVLASDEGLDCGFSRALATRWASSPDNALLLCSLARKGSLADSFWKLRHLPKAALSFSVPVIERIVGEELAGLKEKEEREKRKALEQEEFRRQANELMEGTVGAAVAEANDLLTNGGGSCSNSAATMMMSVSKRRKRSAAMYRRPRYLVFGCRDVGQVVMDAYGEPLAEGECMDRAKVTAQEQRGLLQGLATAAGGLLSTSSSTGNRSQVQRWGYFNEILMTEAEAQLRAGTTALKFVMKESTVDVRWKVRSFNLEGRTDGKNLRAVLTNLCPRRVILVHGSQEAYQDLKRHANKMGTEVMAPSSLLTEAESDSTPSANVIELNFDTKVLDVGLEEEEGAYGRYAPQGGGKGALISLKEMGHYSLGLVNAVASDVLDADGQPFIRCIPTSGQPRQPMLLADGELLLTDTSQKQSIRQKLREAGVSPELTIGAEGAALVCDGKVMVRVRENKVVLEGPLSETYFKVRAVLYSRFVAL